MKDNLGRVNICWLCFVSINLISLLNAGVLSLRYECIPSSSQEVSLGVANCSDQKLGHVPPNLPHNIRVLDLSNNKITALTDFSFVKYESLEILYLRNNTLSRLEPQVFSRLRKLRYLDLSFNNMDWIPSQAFSDLKALLTLFLRGNKIVSIPPNTFKNISKLTSLYLSGNHIEFIHPKAFNGLRNLQQLELQNNALSILNGTTFRYFSDELIEIKLYHNPWYCDCNLRWLVQWLKNNSESDSRRLRWKFHTDEPICAGPGIVEKRLFSTLTGDWFICPIRMYSKARNIETTRGEKVELFCKYMSDPHVDIHWLKNGKLVDLKRTHKYKVDANSGIVITSKLNIYNFQYDDIAEYECYAENRIGRAFDSSLVTLEGVDPSDILLPAEAREDDGEKDRVRNAIIASSTIGGVVLLLVMVGIVLCLATRCKQYHKKKKESIRMSFEEHLKANGIIEPNLKDAPMTYSEVPDGTLSIDAEMDENDSVYDSLQRPRVPSSTNTNTYISFKTEFSEPDDMSTQAYLQEQQANNHSKGSDGSQCESTSPLLENISPILIDPNDPFYEANLYVPRLFASTNNYLSSTQHNYDGENGFLSQKHIQDFIPYTDDNGFILPAYSVGQIMPHRCSTLPHNGHIVHYDQTYIPHTTQTLPRRYSPHHMTDVYNGSVPVVHSNTVSRNLKSASVGHLGMSPPKKPPRSFSSRETVSLHSQSSFGDKENGFKLSLPRPGTVDKYGTAV